MDPVRKQFHMASCHLSDVLLSLTFEFQRKLIFYAPHFVCFHIPKKLQSSVLFLAGHPQPRAGRVSFMLSRKKNADKHTCTGNLQALTSLSKIQQETAIVRTVLLPGDVIVPRASALCLSLSGFVRKPSHSQFLASPRKMQGHLAGHQHEEFIPAGIKAPCRPRLPVCMRGHSATWNSGFHEPLVISMKHCLQWGSSFPSSATGQCTALARLSSLSSEGNLFTFLCKML